MRAYLYGIETGRNGIGKTGLPSCEPTYMGLKRVFFCRNSKQVAELRAYLYGIETYFDRHDKNQSSSCEPTYMGLKRRSPLAP